MDFSDSALKSVVTVCAVIAVCQSVMWIVLTACAILTFRCVLRTPQYDTDHVIVTTIVKLYFEGHECKVEGYPPGHDDFSKAKYTKPIEIFSWMIVLLVVSSFQLIVSVLLFKRGKGEPARIALRNWCFITFIVSAMDAVLTGTFVGDYIAFKDFLALKGEDEDISAAPSAMFIVAARGFVLWIVNICFLLYFSIYLACTSHSHSMEFSGSGGKRGSLAEIGMRNEAFNTSSECLVHRRDGEGRHLSSYDATREMEFFPVTDQQRRFSVSSFEAVTRFNEEEHAGHGADKKRESKKENDRFEYACRKWANGALQSQWRNDLYHSHGCPALKAELEQKLATIRGSEERVHNREKKCTDFSHDLRNFKYGRGGSAKPKVSPHRGGIPKAPPIPAAATCDSSGFY